MTNLTYSVIARSCNKVLIGKTYWKSVVLPSILFASSVITWTKKELQDLQKKMTTRSGDKSWDSGAPRYTPVVALQGEVGASSSTTRDMKNKINLGKHMMQSKNQLLSGIFRVTWEGRVGEATGGVPGGGGSGNWGTVKHGEGEVGGTCLG